MRDLSLHILDIVQNSIRAESTRIQIIIEENIRENLFKIDIIDNGIGMSKQMKESISNPFVTTRTLRKVGLGIPLVKQMSEECEGVFGIESNIGKGTHIKISMKYDHINRLPLGEIQKTISMLIMAKPIIQYQYIHKYGERIFEFDTEEIKKILQGVSIAELEVLKWIEEYIKENIELLNKN